ncbi:MAG: MBL fold metallo-hydrolase [Bacillota bacterium]|nr:MBL fold metallo-hydrolase [Bacillota bacterium]
MTAGGEPRLRILGGVGTIGGTKVLVEEGGFSVLLDCGRPYMPGREWFEGPVRPRPGREVRDLVATGAAPDLPALYEGGAAAPAVFVSHVHQDHMGLLPYLAEGVEVWMTGESEALLRTLVADDPALDRPRAYRVIEPGRPVRVGPLTVRAFPVDHDVPGACAYAVETSAGAVVYTGDLRTHGLHPERTWSFVSAARELEPVALVVEGTRLGLEEEPELPEEEVAPTIARLAAEAPGLVLLGLYPRNVERIRATAAALAGAGRTVAADPVWLRLAGPCPGLAPDPGAEAVAAEPRRWAVPMELARLPELIDLRPPAGSLFIHAGGDPVGRFHPQFGLLLRWLERFGVAYVPVPCSGHARPADLHRIAAGVAATVVLPVHSLHPEAFPAAGLRVLLPEAGRSYDLRSFRRP